ncbi:MAG: class I SAM-dependent methyltransferase [FCB group bacterium]|nr:class I SAM-dependent methyltransferase [FCB group bacterium]
MRKDQDAYGREIYDYWQGDRIAREIVERKDGFISLSSGPAEYFTEYKTWLPQTRRAVRFARGRVLDIGCGAGRHLLYLKQKGHDVVGIDNSPLAIKTCKERGLKNVHVRAVTQIGPDLGQFDTITMFCNNIGLLGSFKRGRWLLKKMHKLTSANGLIIGESLDPYGTDLKEHLEYQRFNRKRGRMSGQLRLRVRYKKYISEWFDYLILSQKELTEILKGTGWHISRTFGPPGSYYSCVMEKDK